jgi:sorbitol/mannitol transport system permease protein
MSELLSPAELPAGRRFPAIRRRSAGPSTPAPPELTSRQKWRRRLPLLPALIYMLIVTQAPFVATVIYSFRSWNTLTPGTNKWAGFKEYKLLFSDPLFRSAAWHTVEITGLAAIISMILAVIIAILINRTFFGRGIVRTAFITPFLIMPVATALLFKTTIFDPIFGILNWVLGPFGIHHENWVGVHSLLALVTVLVWEWTPFMMLIVLAGLQSESQEALEAARVDGANAFQTFARITFPHLRRFIELGMLLGSIYLLQAFGEIFILTQGGGGNGAATTNLPYYIYELAFNQFNVSEAAAAGVIVVIGTEIIASVALRLLSGLFSASEVFT